MKLGYVIAYVPDVGAAVALYQRAFGLPSRFVAEGNQYAELETGQTALAFAAEDFRRQQRIGLSSAPKRGRRGRTEIGLVTDDVERRVARAVEAGTALVKPAAKKPWGRRWRTFAIRTVSWSRSARRSGDAQAGVERSATRHHASGLFKLTGRSKPCDDRLSA